MNEYLFMFKVLLLVFKVMLKDITFDTDKMAFCAVENMRILVHNVGKKGYGLASIGIKSGCYEWKVCFCSVILIHSIYLPVDLG